MRQKQQGFTLIELLITMAIFSVIAVISYYALSSSFKTESIQTQHSDKLFTLQKTLNYIERDITQISNQNVLLIGSEFSFSSLQNEQLLKLRYSFDSGQIHRIDVTSQESQPRLLLIDNLTMVSVRVLDNQGNWRTSWQRQDDNYLKAIEIKFTHPYWGKLIKLVMLDE
jgi:general secretion pathway protein J